MKGILLPRPRVKSEVIHSVWTGDSPRKSRPDASASFSYLFLWPELLLFFQAFCVREKKPRFPHLLSNVISHYEVVPLTFYPQCKHSEFSRFYLSSYPDDASDFIVSYSELLVHRILVSQVFLLLVTVNYWFTVSWWPKCFYC